MTIPPASQQWETRRAAVMARGNVSTAPVYIDRAEGALLGDVEGRVYIDFSGGIGEPVACAAALAVFDIFASEDLLVRGQALGAKLRTRFDTFAARYAIVGDVRGIGPMLALERVEDRRTQKPVGEAAQALVRYGRESGLILLNCGRHGNVIQVLMPLVITDEQLEKGPGILEAGRAQLPAD